VVLAASSHHPLVRQGLSVRDLSAFSVAAWRHRSLL